MSKAKINEEFTTKLRNETFLHFADNSNVGILIIQKGYLKYYNKRFQERFGYTQEEISQWKKREFFKLIHPEDLSQLMQKMKIKDDKTISFKLRAITKEKKIINLEFYLCIIKYNNEKAYLLSHSPLIESFEDYIPKTIRLTYKKKVILDYTPEIIKIFEDNNLQFDIYKICFYKEEDN